MRTSIWLSHNRDPDLIALYRKLGKSEFSNVIKDALRIIVRGGSKKGNSPTGLLLEAKQDEEDIKINIILTSEKDEDVRELLSHVAARKMGAFIKMAIRFYMGPVTTLSGFMDNHYTASLQENIVPMQVFALGGTIQSPVKKVRKPSVKKAKPHISSTSKPSTPQIPLSQPIVNTIPVTLESIEEEPKKNNSNISEEDEMLALLEGLLS